MTGGVKIPAYYSGHLLPASSFLSVPGSLEQQFPLRLAGLPALLGCSQAVVLPQLLLLSGCQYSDAELRAAPLIVRPRLLQPERQPPEIVHQLDDLLDTLVDLTQLLRLPGVGISLI